jgi:hypothetical protein
MMAAIAFPRRSMTIRSPLYQREQQVLEIHPVL